MTKKEREHLTIGEDSESHEIFIGTAKEINEETSQWIQRKNVTREFEYLMARYLVRNRNFEFNLDGKIYRIKVRELAE